MMNAADCCCCFNMHKQKNLVLVHCLSSLVLVNISFLTNSVLIVLNVASATALSSVLRLSLVFNKPVVEYCVIHLPNADGVNSYCKANSLRIFLF